MEEAKLLPCGAVWEYYCQKQETPAGEAWIEEVKNYERTTLAKRA